MQETSRRNTTKRYKVLLEYDGTSYGGWEGNDNSISKQIKDSLYSLSEEEIKIFVAARTDVGVHAIEQVLHFDMIKEIESYKIMNGLNFYLPKDIRIKKVEEVESEFHCRFSAKRRWYKYLIYNGHSLPVFYRKKAWLIRKKLKIDKINEAAEELKGKNDLSTFCPSKYEGLRIRTIDLLEAEELTDLLGYKILSIKIGAKSFLHHQVRYIVESLIKVGCGYWSIDFFRDFFKKGLKLNNLAPPDGLYLFKVEY